MRKWKLREVEQLAPKRPARKGQGTVQPWGSVAQKQEAMPSHPRALAPAHRPLGYPLAQLGSFGKAPAGLGGAWDDGQDSRSRGKSLDLVIPSFPALPKRKCLHSIPTQTLRRPRLAVIS